MWTRSTFVNDWAALAIGLGAATTACRSPMVVTPTVPSVGRETGANAERPAPVATTRAEKPKRSAHVHGYGYIGMRSIEGEATIVDDVWKLEFHFIGVEKTVSTRAKATPRLPDMEAPESVPDPIDSKPKHQYLDCAFEVNDSQLPATLDATCLNEERLEIEGQWNVGNESQPFYLANTREPRSEPGADHAALLETPVPQHGCAPFIELVQGGDGPWETHHPVLYTMRWPCDEPEPTQQAAAYSTEQAARKPDTYVAYVAEVASREPPQLLAAVEVTNLGNGREPDDMDVRLALSEFSPGVQLYMARSTQDWQSNVTSMANARTWIAVWLATVDGKYGPKLELPIIESGHYGVCFADQTELDMWLLDLDSDKVPELVTQTTQNSRGQGENFECEDKPSEVKLLAYKWNMKTLRWSKYTLPKHLSQKQLAAATKLQAP